MDLVYHSICFSSTEIAEAILSTALTERTYCTITHTHCGAPPFPAQTDRRRAGSERRGTVGIEWSGVEG